MKVSEINALNLASYLRIDYDNITATEESELETLFAAARAFIRSYAGLSDDEIDAYPDFCIVVYILVSDMYDNRVLYVDKTNMNRAVEIILDMHSINLL